MARLLADRLLGQFEDAARRREVVGVHLEMFAIASTRSARQTDWVKVPAGHEAGYTFFKVTVEMK